MLAELLADRRVAICAGSGGVGKTTTSAALAAGMAARGRRVAVVTIDPAKRLATSLGLERLGNEPQLVPPARLESHGFALADGGELWAMTLDSKRTFDSLIERLAPDPKAAQEVLDNRIYQQLSSAVAGSQEFTAVAKLYELDRSGRFDLIVLDTPPARNALDFLDAPDRLTGFFGGRALGLFLRPAGIGGRIIGTGSGVVFGLLRRVTGVDLLSDVSVFFRALGGMIDGFRERADGVKQLLADPGTTFLLVTSPQYEPVQEAIHFHRQLVAADMAFGGLVVNRVHELPDGAGSVLPASARDALGERLARRVEAAARDAAALAERDRESLARLHSELGGPPTVQVPQLAGDVHDVDGLALIARYLFSSDPA